MRFSNPEASFGASSAASNSPARIRWARTLSSATNATTTPEFAGLPSQYVSFAVSTSRSPGVQEVNRYGPVPTGLRLKAALLTSCPANAFAGTIPSASRCRNGAYAYFSVNTTVAGSGAVTETSMSRSERSVESTRGSSTAW